MTAVVRLTGLHGNSPVGFLASMGLLSLMGGRMAWDEGCVAVFAPPSGVEDVVSALLKLLHGCSRRYEGFPDHPKNMTPETWQDLYTKRPEWAEVLGGEDKKGFRPTSLCLGAGQLKMVRDALKSAVLVDPAVQDKDVVRARLDEALFGPWQYKDSVHSLCLDPDAKRDGAFSRTEPSKTETRGVAAAYWLAFQGLVVVPVIAGQTSGATRSGWSWVTGPHQRGLSGWRSLVVAASAMSPKELAAQEVTLWHSRFGRSGSIGWLLHPRPVRGLEAAGTGA